MADLFALTELASLVQSDLDTATATLARTNATAVIEAYCRTSFTATGTATDVLRVIDGKVKLPRRPVSEVTTVKAIDSDGTAGATITGWSFDGIDTIDVTGWDVLQINLGEDAGDMETVQVTYDYGYAAVPGDIKAVALDLAASAYANPLKLKQETIGGYSATYAGTGDTFGIALSPSQRLVLDRYRMRYHSVRVR